MVETAFTEESMRYYPIHVQLVQHRIRVFSQARSKHHDFIDFAHLLQEGVDSGSLQGVDVVPIIFNLDWYYLVWLWDDLEASMNQCLV